MSHLAETLARALRRAGAGTVRVTHDERRCLLRVTVRGLPAPLVLRMVGWETILTTGQLGRVRYHASPGERVALEVAP